MADILDAPLLVERKVGSIQGQVQPVAALQNLDPVLDDAVVRRALANAEANNMDPLSVTLEDMVKGQSNVPEPARAAPAVPALAEIPALAVPEKFLKPDGEADVEKILASTRQLDEAIQKKEVAIKTVEDYLAEYKQKETRLRGELGPQLAQLQREVPPPQAPPPAAPSQMTDQQLEELINRDIQANPGRTITQLIQLALDNRFKPIEEDRRVNSVRENLTQLATKDARVLQPEIFKAINAKLASDPDYWKLKNPHRAAWLDVKEEMRLGEPSQVQAQPSRLPAPVLAGGTPPSTPSVSASLPQDILGNLDKIDLRDRRQEALGDEAMRAFLARNSR